MSTDDYPDTLRDHQHDTTGRYWRFDPCGECDDPDCTFNSVDVTAEINAMRGVVEAVGDAIHREPFFAKSTRIEVAAIVEAHRKYLETTDA